jgi:hypothetical protein
VAVKSPNTSQDLTKLNAAKDAARQCLIAADKYLKESQFELARQQLEKAKQLDPSNAYIQAFQDRIAYFEEKRKKEPATHPPIAPPVEVSQSQATAPGHVAPPVQPKTTTPTATARPTLPHPEARTSGEPRGLPAEQSEEQERIALEKLKRRALAERDAADRQRRRELEARTAAEEQRQKELEARVAAEEQRRRELEARFAAEDEVRREIEARTLEDRRRRELEARALAEERLRQELEARVAEEERKRRELEDRVARKELEARALAEEQRRKELEARIAAEEQRRKELEARLAADEQQRREEEARKEEGRKRKELEERAAEEERKGRELEARAVAEERRRKDLEARAAVEEQRGRELEARIAAEEKRRRELEARLMAEEERRREQEARAEQERRRRELEERATEDERTQRAMASRGAEEEQIKESAARVAKERQKPHEVPISVAQPAVRQPAEEQEKIIEMRRQIEELTQALEQEKRAREEITKGNLQNAVKQLRVALEAAWVNGAPVEKAANSLHELALSLSIPAEVEQSIIREVKLEMYSRAVKEVIAKRKLLRSSSSTLEWLRKVYQVSVAEYLENESKFLLDLVADQYKGTILLVSKAIGTKEDPTPRLKSAGYAVVQAATPENALEKIEKVNPNLILCDTEFPESLSGVRFLHVMRANSKFSFVPFILVGEAAEVAQLKSSELKPNEGAIRRPLDYEELTALMNEKLAYFREYISALA